VSRQSVASKDGTEIAYWTSGNGPPLVLVHGTPADHTRWRLLLAYLEPHATVHAMDRRGRGGSGDGEEYALEREYEDVAAVAAVVADASGSAVDVPIPEGYQRLFWPMDLEEISPSQAWWHFLRGGDAAS
jgi:pimeloyl-ACP methyl ester carboxylesterase